MRRIGVVSDNNAETVYIRIPSTTFDGITLTDKIAYIEYINAGNEYNVYKITENEVEDDTIKLGWTIDNNVTRYSGEISFQVTFELDKNYKWSTIPTHMNVLAGLNVDATISSNETTVLTSLLGRVSSLESASDSLDTKIDSNTTLIESVNNAIVAIQETIDSIQQEINYLKNHVVYILDDTE